MRIILIVTMLMLGCTDPPRGHYENSFYIPTEITECEYFCSDQGKVFRIYWDAKLLDLNVIQCECENGTITLFTIDPYSPILEYRR